MAIKFYLYKNISCIELDMCMCNKKKKQKSKEKKILWIKSIIFLWLYYHSTIETRKPLNFLVHTRRQYLVLMGKCKYCKTLYLLQISNQYHQHVYLEVEIGIILMAINKIYVHVCITNGIAMILTLNLYLPFCVRLIS